jgi:hypothetical protein
MSSAAALIDQLEGVRRTGPTRWVAHCPAHEDRQPSLAVREVDDGRVLVHCFGGCSVENVLASVGLTFEALYPARARGDRLPPERRPFPAVDVLRALANESLVTMCAASAVAQGKLLSATDRDRLTVAASRFQAALTETAHA